MRNWKLALTESEEFAYAAAHNLRSPLRGIDGFCQVVLEEDGARLSQEGRQHLGRVRQAAQTMAGLIEALLKLSRINRMKMARQPIDLSALARSTAENLRRRDHERQVEFVIPDGLVAECDGLMVQVLLEELLENAWKFTTAQLAGGIAYDFNNLLTIINGFSDLLLNQLKPDDPSRAFLEQIKHAGERSASLTRQLLIFSRKHVPTLQKLDVNVVIGEAEKMLGRSIGEDIKLVTDLGARLRNINADPGQIEQILFNLVINARDAMPHGGQVTIRTRNVTYEEGYSRPLPDMPLGNYVLLEIADTGTGMTPDVLGKIFEPFFTTKEVGKGTGLGLATVFGIVKQYAGHVAVESHSGAGATFRIYLPEATEAAVATNNQPPPNAEVASRGNEVILLAEDEDNVRMLMNQILVKNGYTVLEAKDGKDALRLAGTYTTPIHALITDVVMPEMGGFDLARRLRLIHPETKVLFVSGYPNHPELRKQALTGEVDFMPKPLSPSGLTSKLRAILDATLLEPASHAGNGTGTT